MITVLVVVGYVLAALWTMRRCAWIVYDDSKYIEDGRVDGMALSLGLFIGAILGAIWPLTAIWLIGRRIFQKDGNSVLRVFTSAPKGVPTLQRLKQLEEEAKAREDRIARLERDLGVR